ncbi:MAG: hypothetical protein M1821_004080 [Bathelium mastoideum]|nr:MAG: hypothetical protein M1821_004080 [Bathelium mastoideum]KAI9691148.1 MAG: hypothetical protein M1822_008768 [Bathelium mastoideum]
MAASNPARPRCTLNDLCDELLLDIFHYLDVPDLLATSRTSHRLRTLSTDPILHAHRIRLASHRLARRLPRRPPLQALLPPVSAIYLTTTHVAARTLSRALVAIRLNHCLRRRPSAAALVDKGVLPGECFVRERRSGYGRGGNSGGKGKGKGRGIAGAGGVGMGAGGGTGEGRGEGDVVRNTGVAWGIVEARRRVERERVKDGLRVKVARMARKIQTGRVEGRGACGGVWSMVWRFSRGEKGRGMREKEKGGEEVSPGRTRVGGLRQFWEGMAEAQTGCRQPLS